MSAAARPVLGNKAWGDTTSVYDSAATRSTSLAARHLISMAHEMNPIGQSSCILDLGVGAGATTLETARAFPTSTILATDVAEGMVDFVRKLAIPNVTTQVLDAADVGSLGHRRFSHVLSTFMLQFMLRPTDVVAGAYQVLQPGGVIGLGLWYEDGDFWVCWDKACRLVDPSKRIGHHFVDPNAWTTDEEVKRRLQEVGFVDVEIKDVHVPFRFPSAEAYVDFVCRSKVPSAEILLSQWTGDVQEVARALTRLVREEYGDGKDLRLHALLAVGRKPVA